MQAIYLLAPIYFKHNLQHIIVSRNYNYIVWKGANDIFYSHILNIAKAG